MALTPGILPAPGVARHPYFSDRYPRGGEGMAKYTDVRLTPYFQQRHPSYNANAAYMANGAAGGHPNLPPGAAPLLPNQGRVIQSGPLRVLCIADVRGTMRPPPPVLPPLRAHC